jgi:hypothetical protein
MAVVLSNGGIALLKRVISHKYQPDFGRLTEEERNGKLSVYSRLG